MSLIRSKQRVADHGEVFTPPWLVDAMLDLVKDEANFPRWEAVQKALEKEFKSLDKVPKQRLLDALKSVEDKLRKLIEDGKAPIKDGHLAEDEPRDSNDESESYA